MFYDEAILGHKNTVWYNQANAWTIDPKSDGTEISIAQSSIQSLFANGGNSWASAQVFEPPFAVEFDLLAITGELSIYVLGNNFISHGFSQNGSGHYKLIITGSKVYKIKDGENIQTPYDKEMAGLFQIGFRGTTANAKYKNFVVYPI